MPKLSTSMSFKRRCVACGQREDDAHSLALHYNCLTCIGASPLVQDVCVRGGGVADFMPGDIGSLLCPSACKSFFYRSGKQLRAAGVAEDDLTSRGVYERVLDNHARYTKCLNAGMDPVLVLGTPPPCVCVHLRPLWLAINALVLTWCDCVVSDPSKRAGSRAGRSRRTSRSTPSTPKVVKPRNASTQTDPAFIFPSDLCAKDIPKLLTAMLKSTGAVDTKAVLGHLVQQLSAATSSAPPAAVQPSVSASHYQQASFAQPPSVDTFDWGDQPSLALTHGQPQALGHADSAILAPPSLPDTTLCDPLFQELLLLNELAPARGAGGHNSAGVFISS